MKDLFKPVQVWILTGMAHYAEGKGARHFRDSQSIIEIGIGRKRPGYRLLLPMSANVMKTGRSPPRCTDSKRSTNPKR